MSNTLQVRVIIGSTRQKRYSDKPAAWITAKLGQREGLDAEILDLRDYPMPFYDEPVTPSSVKDGAYANPAVRSWAERIAEADAFVVVTPEYNRGPSAVMKNAFDQVSAEWNKKPIAFIGHGSTGATRAIEQLRMNAIELQMVPIRAAVYLPPSWTSLADDGSIKKEVLEANDTAADTLVEQIAWWGRVLKAARASA